jgi:uncharacterized protein YdhG (YjbR/CyaY superfamily)
MTERGSAEAGPLSAYLEALAEPARGALTAVVERARDLLPDLTEGVSYGMAALLYRGVALLAVRETVQHLALYPYSGHVVRAVAARLDADSFSSGAIRFSAAHPLPGDLVDEVVLARRDEIDARLGPPSPR